MNTKHCTTCHYLASPWVGRWKRYFLFLLVGCLSLVLSNTAYSQGTGGFADRIFLESSGANSGEVGIADFDGNGTLDFAFANYLGASISIALNNGNGTFTPQVHYTTGGGTNPYGLVIGDFNKDNIQDIIVGLEGPVNAVYFQGVGNGTFLGGQTLNVGASMMSIATADFDSDTNLDFVGSYNGYGTVNTGSVVFGNGNGTFVTPSVTLTANTAPLQVVAAPLDNNASPDVAMVCTNGTVSVFMNSGSRTFAGKVDYAVANGSRGLTSGDIDGDGDIDLVAIAPSGVNPITILTNNGSGIFTPISLSGTGATAIKLIDINADSRLDLVYSGTNIFAVRVGNGNGTFGPEVSYAISGDSRNIVAGDINGDNRIDIVSGDGGNNMSIRYGLAPTVIVENHTNAFGVQYTVPVTGDITSCQGTASSKFQQFRLRGTVNLTTANITVTAPTHFEVSTTTAGGFASVIQLPAVSGSVATVSVYVRSAASAPLGYIQDVVSISTTGATTRQVTVAAMIVPTNSITLSRNGVNQGAYCSIQSAHDAALNGDVITLAAGTYREQVTITKGITLRGAGTSNTIIQSPDAAFLSVQNGNWKSLRDNRIYAVIGIVAPAANATVTIASLTIDGRDQGFIPEQTAEGSRELILTFHGIAARNTNVVVDSVSVTGVRELATSFVVNRGVAINTTPAGYVPEDQPAGANNHHSIFSETEISSDTKTLIVRNSRVQKFQKTGIMAWGPKQHVNIHNNHIQGYGNTMWTTQNGMQFGSSDRTSMGGGNGDRRFTQGQVVNNTFSDLGLVIPAPGQPGTYLDKSMFYTNNILVFHVGGNFLIANNTITRGNRIPSWYDSFTSHDGGYGSGGITVISSTNCSVVNNNISNFDVGFSAEGNAYISASGNTVTNNGYDIMSVSSSGERYILQNNPERIGIYARNMGIDTIANFSNGDKITVINITTGTVNGMLGANPSIVFSGTLSSGNGTNVSPYSVQVTTGASFTNLFIDTDGIAGPAELQVHLEGIYLPQQLSLNGPNIEYASVELRSNGVSRLFGTIQAAANASKNGDSILIPAGTFVEQVVVTTGITIIGVDTAQTIIRSPLAAELATNANWRSLKISPLPIDIISLLFVRTTTAGVPVVIKKLKIDGFNQGYQNDTRYPDKNGYTFNGITCVNSNVIIDSVAITRIRALYSDYPGSVLPAGYLPADQPGGFNHMESILAEGAADQPQCTVTIRNSYIDKFQKTAIIAWGPTLMAIIEGNKIQGYGKTLFSTGNGIQIASSALRTGTRAIIRKNQILDMGIVVPQPGQEGSYFNQFLGGSTCILTFNAGSDLIIDSNVLTRQPIYSWNNSQSSANGGWANAAINVWSSSSATITNNVISGFDAGIINQGSDVNMGLNHFGNIFSLNLVDYYMQGIGVDTITLGNQSETIGYITSNVGVDLIRNFGTGDKFNLVFRGTGVVNGVFPNGQPSMNYSAGTITYGDGTNVEANSVQVATSATHTTLYIDRNATAGPREVEVRLEGVYPIERFSLNGPNIEYASVELRSNGVSRLFGTIQAAANASKNGDSILIPAGTFVEQVVVTTGVTIVGVDTAQTIIRSPLAASLTTATIKNLKNQDVLSVIYVNTTTAGVPVVIKKLKVDGFNQGYQNDTRYPDKNSYTFNGIACVNSNVTIDSVAVTRVRALYSDYPGSTLPAGYLPTDQPGGFNHMESIIAEGAAGQPQCTVTIKNSYVDKFQKTAIIAWGPTLTAIIEGNRIQGYGKTLFSTGNGIQIASAGLRTATKAIIRKNQILDMGIVVPEPGQPGTYFNQFLGGSTCILTFNAGANLIIDSNVFTRQPVYSWNNSQSSANGGWANAAINVWNSSSATITNNVVSGFDVGIINRGNDVNMGLNLSGNTFSQNLEDYSMQGIGVDTITLGNQSENIGYVTDNAGVDLIRNFGSGDKFNLVRLVTGVLNGVLNGQPSMNFSEGTITYGDGTNVAANSVQVATTATHTTLYIDRNATAGPREVEVRLEGQYVPGNFLLTGNEIRYQQARPRVAALVPSITTASANAMTVTITGANIEQVTALTIQVLNSSGLPVGVRNIISQLSSNSNTSLTISLPAGTVATGGSLTITLTNFLGTTSADLLVQSDNIIVTNANNDGGGSLRRAFALTSTGGTIQIQGSIPPVTLTDGPIEVNKEVRLIDNNGGLQINGNGAPIFDVQCGGNLYLENVILTGSGNNPAIRNDCGTVILRRSRATGN